MATRSLIIDLFKSPNGTSYGVLIAVFIVVLTTGFASNLFICCYRLALWIDFMLNLMSPVRSMTCALWSVSLHWSVRWSISIYIYKRESIKQAEFTEIQDNFLKDRQPATWCCWNQTITFGDWKREKIVFVKTQVDYFNLFSLNSIPEKLEVILIFFSVAVLYLLFGRSRSRGRGILFVGLTDAGKTLLFSRVS